MTYEIRKMSNNAVMSGIRQPVTVPVTEEHHIAKARLTARALAEAIGFERFATYDVATSVSELANNLFFHAACGGLITLVSITRNSEIGIEVIAEDYGPGIPDVNLALRDGFSTNRGLGGGLPGVERLMNDFEIASTVGVGTRVVARKWQFCK